MTRNSALLAPEVKRIVTDRLQTEWLHTANRRHVDIRARLARNLRKLRQEKGLSQEEFAFEAKIHRTYISDLERAARNPTITVIDKLAKTLDVQPGKLLD